MFGKTEAKVEDEVPENTELSPPPIFNIGQFIDPNGDLVVMTDTSGIVWVIDIPNNSGRPVTFYKK